MKRKKYYINVYKKGDDYILADNAITHRTKEDAEKVIKENFADGFVCTMPIHIFVHE